MKTPNHPTSPLKSKDTSIIGLGYNPDKTVKRDTMSFAVKVKLNGISDKIHMAKGFDLSKGYIGVRCPDCGAGGGTKYPCWCHVCHKQGQKVMMLPSCNDHIISNWPESVK